MYSLRNTLIRLLIASTLSISNPKAVVASNSYSTKLQPNPELHLPTDNCSPAMYDAVDAEQGVMYSGILCGREIVVHTQRIVHYNFTDHVMELSPPIGVTSDGVSADNPFLIPPLLGGCYVTDVKIAQPSVQSNVKCGQHGAQFEQAVSRYDGSNRSVFVYPPSIINFLIYGIGGPVTYGIRLIENQLVIGERVHHSVPGDAV